MNVAAINKYCASLPHAVGEIKWQVDMIYMIGGKMFAGTYENDKGKGNVSFKVDDERFLEFTDREGFIPAPYMARAKWVQVQDLKKVSDAEMKALLKRSYELVAAKLTKKLRTELGLI